MSWNYRNVRSQYPTLFCHSIHSPLTNVPGPGLGEIQTKADTANFYALHNAFSIDQWILWQRTTVGTLQPYLPINSHLTQYIDMYECCARLNAPFPIPLQFTANCLLPFRFGAQASCRFPCTVFVTYSLLSHFPPLPPSLSLCRISPSSVIPHCKMK